MGSGSSAGTPGYRSRCTRLAQSLSAAGLGESEAARGFASHCRRGGCRSSCPGAVTLPQPHPYGMGIYVDTHMYARVAALAGRTSLGGRARGSPRSPRGGAGPGRRRGERRGRARRLPGAPLPPSIHPSRPPRRPRHFYSDFILQRGSGGAGSSLDFSPPPPSPFSFRYLYF